MPFFSQPLRLIVEERHGKILWRMPDRGTFQHRYGGHHTYTLDL